jgi:hypothetical protein
MVTELRTWRDVGLMALVMASGTAYGQTFQTIPMTPRAVSADGTTVVGTGGPQLNSACYWKSSTNQVISIGVPSGYLNSSATCVSGDGGVIGGFSEGGPMQGFIWTKSGGFQLVSVPGTAASNVTCVSRDGRVAGGIAVPPGAFYQSMVWTSEEGGRLIPSGANYSTWMHALAADGNRAVGSGSSSLGTWGAYRPSTHLWCFNMGAPSDLQSVYMLAITGTGDMCVGRAHAGTPLSTVPVVWTEAAGQRVITELAGFSSGLFQAVSDTGLAGGRGNTGSNAAILWTEGLGVVRARDYAIARGVNVTLTGLAEVTGISADGRVIVGIGGGSGWIIDLGRCGSADFNHDGDLGTDQDIEAFFACLGGRCCAACDSADFNGDGDYGTDQDIEAFFRRLSGAPC